MGRRPVARNSDSTRQALENIRMLKEKRIVERRAEQQETLRYAAQNYAKKYGKTLGGIAQRYIDLAEGSEYVMLNNKPSKYAKPAQEPDKPTKVYQPVSTKFSYTMKMYKDLQNLIHFDFRDAEALPTKHLSVTNDELHMMLRSIIADMNYTELIKLIEQTELRD